MTEFLPQFLTCNTLLKCFFEEETLGHCDDEGSKEEESSFSLTWMQRLTHKFAPIPSSLALPIYL